MSVGTAGYYLAEITVPSGAPYAANQFTLTGAKYSATLGGGTFGILYFDAGSTASVVNTSGSDMNNPTPVLTMWLIVASLVS